MISQEEFEVIEKKIFALSKGEALDLLRVIVMSSVVSIAQFDYALAGVLELRKDKSNLEELK